MMKIYKSFMWFIAAMLVVMPSCKESEDVNGSGDYDYYLDIQSEVRLNLNDAADEDESGKVNPMVDCLSRTIYRMQKAIREKDDLKGNRNKKASLLSTCDNLYRNYADMNPENKGRPICYVKLLRCPLNPNGTANFNGATTLKYYIFWRDSSDIDGDEDSSSDN